MKIEAATHIVVGRVAGQKGGRNSVLDDGNMHNFNATKLEKALVLDQGKY